MISDIARLFKSSPWFLLFSIGYLITGIGSGLTSVAIYGALSQQAASTEVFALAFAFSVLPSLASTNMGMYLGRRLKPLTVLIVAEVCGALCLLIPLTAVKTGNTSLLTVAIMLPSLFAGIGVYSYAEICKRAFSDHEFSAVAAVQTISFSAVTIVGIGIGSILYPSLSSTVYFIADCASFICAIALLLCARRRLAASRTAEVNQIGVVAPASQTLRGFSPHQLLAILLLPLLSVITAPAMALLPAKGAEFSSPKVAGLPVDAVNILLFARGLGQLLGPLLSTDRVTRMVFYSSKLRLGIFAVFIGIYYFVFWTDSLPLMWMAVVVAHIFSNIFFSTAYSFLLRSFSNEDAGFASVRSNQIQVLTLGLAAALSGFLAGYLSLQATLLAFALPGLLLTSWVFLKLKVQEVSR